MDKIIDYNLESATHSLLIQTHSTSITLSWQWAEAEVVNFWTR